MKIIGIYNLDAFLRFIMPPGRISHPIEWKSISYKDGTYHVGKIQFNDTYIWCVMDAVDKEHTETHSWHVVGGDKIGCDGVSNGKRIVTYLHKYILSHINLESIVDHINGIGFDNRRANLREVKPEYQHLISKQRARATEKLPADIQPEDIPRNIWYTAAKDLHGDRFAVEFKGVPVVGDICKKTTSSKSVSAKDKLQQAICIREELMETYPVLKEYSRDSEKAIQLKWDYENIVALAEGKSMPHTGAPTSVRASYSKLTSDAVDILNTLHAGSRIEQPAQIPVPKQWKTRDIFDFLAASQEHHYKAYCESNNEIKEMNWPKMWSDFIAIKGQPWATAEPHIRAFVESLREIRQRKLIQLQTQSRTASLLDREDRQVWPAETVAALFLAGRIGEFKTMTETYAGDDPKDPKWMKRWEEFVGTLEAQNNDKTALTKEIAKFMHAQRAKKFRRSKQSQ